MDGKSGRTITEKEKKKNSLVSRIFRMTFAQAFFITTASLIISLTSFTLRSLNSYVEKATQVARSAAGTLEEFLTVKSLANKVMEAYSAQSDEERAEQEENYRKRFDHLMYRGDYIRVKAVLGSLVEDFGLTALYAAGFDLDRSALVYIVEGGDPAETVKPGDWEEVDKEGFATFLNLKQGESSYYIDYNPAYGLICTSGAPIVDRDGSVAAYVFVDVVMPEIMRGIIRMAVTYVIVLIIVAFLILGLTTRRIRKRLVTPIAAIADAARGYDRDRDAGVTTFDHFSELNIHTGDELEELSLVMANMETSIAEYTENLTAVTAEKERMSTELSLAARIQEAMLPHTFPPFPDRGEFEIYASMDPAREVGGDFYDFFLIDDDHLCLIIADVSGKGIPAALFMMSSMIRLQSAAKMGQSPAAILERLNNEVCATNETEMFVTVWIGILEISTGKLTAANAGHEYPFVIEPDGSAHIHKDKHGFVIGGMGGMHYKEYELELKRGAGIFVYTDGVPEATNAELEIFGTDRVTEALNTAPLQHPKEALDAVRTAIDAFVKDAEQFDDLTMLALIWRGSEEGR